jgi:hypothetical protein
MLAAVRSTSKLALDEVLDELLEVVPGPGSDDDIALIALRTDLAPAQPFLLLPQPRRAPGRLDG